MSDVKRPSPLPEWARLLLAASRAAEADADVAADRLWREAEAARKGS